MCKFAVKISINLPKIQSMQSKSSILFLVAFLIGCGTLTAQTEPEKKTMKKTVIIKKTVDENGNVTTEKTVTEDSDIDEDTEIQISEGEGKATIIRIEKETDTDEKKDGKEKEIRKEIRVMSFSSDEDELSPEMIKQLKEEGIDLEIMMKEGKGEKEMIWITEDDQEIELDGEKMIFISEGDEKSETEHEVIILNDDGKEVKTKARMMRTAPTTGNTLKVKNLNINIDNQTLTLDIGTEAVPMTLRLLDTDGKSVYEEKITKFDGKLNRKINLQKAAAGPLFLVLKGGDKIFSERIVR